jgi:hypothetical protein
LAAVRLSRRRHQPAGEVRRLARIVAHAKYYRERGEPIEIFHPDLVAAPGTGRDSFRSTIRGALEIAILLPLYRELLFERVDFPSPLYGTIAPGSFFEASQFTHCCGVTRGVPARATSLAALSRRRHARCTYALMIGIPIGGSLILSVEGDPVPFWGLTLPPLVALNDRLAELIEEIQETVGTAGYWLISLHAAAAPFQHYFMRDNTQRRMLDGASRDA